MLCKVIILLSSSVNELMELQHRSHPNKILEIYCVQTYKLEPIFFMFEFKVLTKFMYKKLKRFISIDHKKHFHPTRVWSTLMAWKYPFKHFHGSSDLIKLTLKLFSSQSLYQQKSCLGCWNLEITTGRSIPRMQMLNPQGRMLCFR